jgi:uncharacterized repeat protein (TIGR02543 family)
LKALFRLIPCVLFVCVAWVLQPGTAQAAPAAAVGITTTLTINTTGSGQVNANPAGPIYDYGQEVTLTATPASGWSFSDWSGTLGAPAWWNGVARYRVAVSIGANGFARTDKPAEAPVNFTPLLAGLGENGPFDPNSLRVVEINAAGQVVNANVHFQFDKDSDYHKVSKAAGTLVIYMNGATAANAGRTYHVYFDVEGSGLSLPNPTGLVNLTVGADENQQAYIINTPIGRWTYQTPAAGFASLDDVQNNDWLTYRYNQPASAGVYRGVPNMISPFLTPGGGFHPGATNATSLVIYDGPVRKRIRSTIIESNVITWETLWDIFPGYARQTVLKANHNFWFLYEGTPGGVIDANDHWTRPVPSGGNPTTTTRIDSTNTSYQLSADLAGDEWAFFSQGDPRTGATRSLFLINHQDDNYTDWYRFQNDNSSGPLSGAMTVFGFGRNNANPQIPPSAVPVTFTIGLMQNNNVNHGISLINGAYKDLAIQVGPAEAHDAAPPNPSGATLVVKMTTSRTINATFTLPSYTVTRNVTPAAGGSIAVASEQPGYPAGTQVSLTATPLAGYIFSGWSGDLSGSQNPVTLTMNGNKTVTATFAPTQYSLTVNSGGEGAGSVSSSPSAATHPYGQVVQLTATAQPGSTFTGWTGSATSSANPLSLFMDGNKTVTANFAKSQYTLSVNQNGGNSVTVSPAKQAYNPGEEVTLTAISPAGWTFDRWSGSATGSTNPVTLTMDSDQSVFAVFRKNLYAVTTSVTGSGTVTRSPARSGYGHGDMVILTATPAPGWTFAGWGGALSGANPVATLTVTGDAAVSARFERE